MKTIKNNIRIELATCFRIVCWGHSLYYSEVRKEKNWGLGVFLLQYFPQDCQYIKNITL